VLASALRKTSILQCEIREEGKEAFSDRGLPESISTFAIVESCTAAVVAIQF